MLKHSKLVGFVATSKPESSRRFYGELLGLSLIEESPYAIVFESHDTIIRVQKTEQVFPPPYTSLGWEVENINEIVRSLSDAGVQFEQFQGLEQDAAGVWSVPNGSKVAWLKDPDGNLLSLTQPNP
ncbi:MAG: VOC family protein [Granulosicoccus sp.]|nr:VOC family protein [Granulosicoccus sp.]